MAVSITSSVSLEAVVLYNAREYPTVSNDVDDTANPQAKENGVSQKFHPVRLAEPQYLRPHPTREIFENRRP